GGEGARGWRRRAPPGGGRRARPAPASTSAVANATTVTAPVGASSRKDPKIPTALASAPAAQPIASAGPMCGENRPPISAGTMRKQNTSKTPAVPTDEVTTTPNDR